MSNHRRYCRIPEEVPDLVQDLLASDIISKKDIAKLKNDDDFIRLDPNLVMDLRHKQIRKASVVECVHDNLENTPRCSKRHKKIPVVGSPVKDLKTIDKEIEMTKKKLERLNNQISKNEEIFTTSILAIKSETEKILNASKSAVKFNDTEIKKYFEIHLDNLEDKLKADENNSDASKKMWTPLQIEFPPVINVETSSKVSGYNNIDFELNNEELTILELFDIKPICVMGKPVEQVSLSEKTKKQYEPTGNTALNNSLEDLAKDELMNCRTNGVSGEEITVAKATLGKWKTYVKQRKIQRLCDTMKTKTLNGLMKRVFTAWHSHAKYVKSMKDSRMLQLSKTSLDQSQVNDCGMHTSNKVEAKNEYPIEKFKNNKTKDENETNNSKNNQRNIFCENGDSFITKSMNICPKNSVSATNVIANDFNSGANDCDTQVTEDKRQVETNNTDNIKSYICRKIVTPECVGLPSALTKPKLQNTKSNIIQNRSKGTHKCLQNLFTNSEQFYFRYAAQEQIIAQQLAVIENQKQIILDLQVENLEKTSALQKIKVDTQLKTENAKKEKKQKCYVNDKKPFEAEKAVTVNKQSIDDKAQELTNRMLSRHEYCKQLAEKSKNRKIRIEEEKARIKAELEEREKIEKEKKKKQRLKQIRIEQVLAEECAKLNLAKKQKIDEQTKTALNHYNKTLLRNAYHKLKEAVFARELNIQQCNKMFNMKLLKRTFHLLKINTSESLSIKYEAANQFFNNRLIKRHWFRWHQVYQEYKIKVQVSVDMFELSLQRRMFHRWQHFMAEQYKQTIYKEELADRLYTRKLLQHCLNNWRELPRLVLAEREREIRLNHWRRIVREIIPDFRPVKVEPCDI